MPGAANHGNIARRAGDEIYMDRAGFVGEKGRFPAKNSRNAALPAPSSSTIVHVSPNITVAVLL